MPAKTRRKYKGGATATTISAPLTAGSTSIAIVSATGWPTSGPFYVVVDPGTASEEKMLIGSISSTTLSSITRGVDDTSDVSHVSGAAIYPVFTAVDADEANELTSKYTTRGDIVYQGASTFETLAKGTANHVLKQGANDPAWGYVTNDNVDASAAIVDTKLATISTANKVSVASIDIDGATDIGADLVDADLIIVDDGAGGTNRKSAISRFAKFLFSKVSGDITVTDAGVASIGSGVIVNADVNASAGIALTKLEQPAWETFGTTANFKATTTNPNVGSTGSWTMVYQQIGKTVFVRGRVSLNGTGVSAGSGQYRIDLPVTAKSASAGSSVGIGALVDSLTLSYPVVITLISTTQASFYYFGSAAGISTTSIFDSTGTPFTLAAGDYIDFNFTYEAA